MKKEYWDVSNEQVIEKTGQSIDTWIALLTAFLEIWRFEDLKIWRFEDLEIWRFEDLEIWRFRLGYFFYGVGFAVEFEGGSYPVAHEFAA